MQAKLVSTLTLLLTGCVSFTTSGTKEAVLFSGNEAAEPVVQPVLKPYGDLPLEIRFACPDRIATLSTFYVFPLPPVVPVGFANKDVAYLRVRMPEDAEPAVAQTRIVRPDGSAMPLSDVAPTRRAYRTDGTLEATYKIGTACASLDGGALDVAAFSYNGRAYPASRVQLRFDSRVAGSLGWWPPAMFRDRLAQDEAEDFQP